jgi:steroid delta-isomerase
MPDTSTDPRTARLVDGYERLTPGNLPALMSLYDEQATFKDPFNDVRGRSAIERIFRGMFDELREPRFVITVAASEGDDAFLTWELHFLRQSAGQPMTIRGATHLRYAAGLVIVHRDYWDAAEELYAKLPVLGVLMRALRRRLSASGPAAK